MKTQPIKMIVFSALFTALIVLGSYIAIPAGKVPFVLQNFFVFLAALLLGPKWGTVSVVVYLLLGLLGLPVFSQGRAGYIHLIGPTGGYLFSYILAAACAGIISSSGRTSVVRDSIACVVAALLVYAVGVPWLKLSGGMTWDKAFLGGMAPFLLWDAFKIAAAVIIARFLRPLFDEIISRGNDDDRV